MKWNPHRHSLCELVGGRWCVLIDGIQWGPAGVKRDPSGAADCDFESAKEAFEAFMEDN